MRTNKWVKYLLGGLLTAVIWIPPKIILAQDNVERYGFVLGGWAGYGQTDVNTDNEARSSYGTFALGFSGGYAITSTIAIGMEVNGWTLKAFDINDPSRGESISNFSIFINYFPVVGLPLFIEGGGGRVLYTNNSPNENGREKGGSWFVGCGYEVPISQKFILFPQMRYSQGDFTGGDYKIYEFSLGMKWYSKCVF